MDLMMFLGVVQGGLMLNPSLNWFLHPCLKELVFSSCVDCGSRQGSEQRLKIGFELH